MVNMKLICEWFIVTKLNVEPQYLKLSVSSEVDRMVVYQNSYLQSSEVILWAGVIAGPESQWWNTFQEIEQ